jgi:hypothetical protein
MERRPQQQTLSIRISESLRQYLERSKRVIAAGKSENVSTSDVAKILLESAKDDRLDVRLEVGELGQMPTETMVAIRKKWEVGQPRSRAEWIFMAQYIQVACEELTGDPLAPSAESYAALLESLLAVRALRMDRGVGLDRYYLSNLVAGGAWNDRKLDEDLVPKLVGRLIEEIRASGSGKEASGVGRCFYAAIRDEEFQEIMTLNNVLTPHMNTLFRMAARGHWIKEKRPVRLIRDGSLLLGPVPTVRQGDLSLSVATGPTDISFSIGIDSGDLIYIISGYAQIREFAAMLKVLTPEKGWDGENFHGQSSAASPQTPARYQFRRDQDGVTLGFNQENWQKLKALFFAATEQPQLQTIFSELSLIYGEL